MDPAFFPKIPNSGDGQQVSLEPLRTWEVNLETRKLTLRTGGMATMLSFVRCMLCVSSLDLMFV